MEWGATWLLLQKDGKIYKEDLRQIYDVSISHGLSAASLSPDSVTRVRYFGGYVTLAKRRVGTRVLALAEMAFLDLSKLRDG